MKKYEIVETFEIDGQTHEAGSIVELPEDVVSRVSASYLKEVPAEDGAAGEAAAEAGASEEAKTDEAAAEGEAASDDADEEETA